MSNLPESPQNVCPNCGYCPHCGKSNVQPVPYHPVPYPWTQPYIPGTPINVPHWIVTTSGTVS